jgi:hypothetical protein
LNKDARLGNEQIPDGIQDDGDRVRGNSWRERREENEADADNSDGRSVSAHWKS